MLILIQRRMSTMPTPWEERHTAMHLLRAGHSVSEVAHQLDRTPQWVRKWRKRFEEKGWQGLADRPHAPHTHGTRFSGTVRCAIAQARSELEAEAAWGTGLKYVGGPAVRTRLKAQPGQVVPSVATIERVLREKEMTRPYQALSRPEIQYPHLHPSEPHQLCQADIVPHMLTGGEGVACFNAIDVVSRYPSGQAYAQQRSQDAANFLLHVWQTIGIAQYTQLDNEGCFSGGFTHPYVLGKVVRLALSVGTELVFSPVRHPQSNGSVERFHQDYDRHVWEDTYLDSRNTVDQQADHFFQLYRHSRHHTALNEQTPYEVHHRIPPRRLDPAFRLPEHKLPLREGRVHFMRAVRLDGTISVLNADWPVLDILPHTGVWATLELRCTGATLSIYDAAPDQPQRTCLTSYPFPLSEPVQPYQPADSTVISCQSDELKPSSQGEPAGEPISAPTLLFGLTHPMLNRVESLPLAALHRTLYLPMSC
jgi:transposase InsO family protein